MQILEIVIGRHRALKREQEWIRSFQEQGMPLLNTKRKPNSKLSLKPLIPLLQDSLFARDSRGQQPTDSENVNQPENEEVHQREERILDATMSLLLRWGYRKTTLNDVSREAGMGNGAAYLRGKDKSELFHAAIWREGRRLNEDIKRRIAADPAGEVFHRAVTHSMLAALSNPFVASMFRSKSILFEEFLGSSNQDAAPQTFIDVNASIAQRQHTRQVRADLPASVIMFLLISLTVGIINSPDFMGEELKPSMDQLTELLSDLLRRWLEPEHPPYSTRGEEHEIL